MLILTNQEVSELLSMENCLRHLESAYKELSDGEAVNRPRSDLYLPATTSGGVYCFKTMEGGLNREKVVALRLNSDVIKCRSTPPRCHTFERDSYRLHTKAEH